MIADDAGAPVSSGVDGTIRGSGEGGAGAAPHARFMNRRHAFTALALLALGAGAALLFLDGSRAEAPLPGEATGGEPAL